MNTSDTPILFLSGAGLPAWIWDDVRKALSVDSSVASYQRRSDATLRDYAAAALEQAPGRVTLVAHSIGGVVASEIVSMAPDRVDGVLGIAAAIPPAGASFLGALPMPQRLVMGLIMRFVGTKPPASAIRSGLCAGLRAEDTARVVAEFESESQRLYRDAVSPRVFPERRGYVTASADREFPVVLQRKFAAELAPDFHTELPTGHLPMVADPESLARIISEFKGGVEPLNG